MKKIVFGLSWGLTLLVAFLFGWWLGREAILDTGRVYPNRTTMCTHFAQSYLLTIRQEPGFNEDKWQKAIDIETEFFNLCMLDLAEEKN